MAAKIVREQANACCAMTFTEHRNNRVSSAILLFPETSSSRSEINQLKQRLTIFLNFLSYPVLTMSGV